MERLQAAIEKARAQREGGAVSTPEAFPSSAAAPAHAPAAAVSAGTGSMAGSLEEKWLAFRPLDTSGAQYRKPDHLVAFTAGAPATPYDMLRTRIVQQAVTHGWKRIAIVSPHAGSGKTTTVANLAFSLGRQTEMRTMVIDFDLRRATLAGLLGQTPEATMGDVLEGRVPFVDHGYRYQDNVVFGLNSRPVAHSSELLQSQRARLAMEAIEEQYQPDLTLFDLPPLLATDDTFGFLKHVDCAVIVVAAEETPMSQIDVTERQVAEVTSVMGVVLNKCRVMGDSYAYDYSGY